MASLAQPGGLARGKKEESEAVEKRALGLLCTKGGRSSIGLGGGGARSLGTKPIIKEGEKESNGPHEAGGD